MRKVEFAVTRSPGAARLLSEVCGEVLGAVCGLSVVGGCARVGVTWEPDHQGSRGLRGAGSEVGGAAGWSQGWSQGWFGLTRNWLE